MSPSLIQLCKSEQSEALIQHTPFYTLFANSRVQHNLENVNSLATINFGYQNEPSANWFRGQLRLTSTPRIAAGHLREQREQRSKRKKELQ